MNSNDTEDQLPLRQDDQLMTAIDDVTASAPEQRGSRIIEAYSHYTSLLFYILVIASVAAFGGTLFWWADYLAHPRLHMTALLAVVTILMLLRLKWLQVTVGLGCILLNAAAMIFALPTSYQLTNSAGLPPGEMKVISITTDQDNRQAVLINKWIISEKPDLVFLIGANRSWLADMTNVMAELPYQKLSDRIDQYGSIILSRFPINHSEINLVGPRSLPVLSAEIESPLGRINAVGIHANAPGIGGASHDRDLYLAQISAMAQSSPIPTLLSGSFNATPWSTGYNALRGLPMLQPSSWVIPPSWPAAIGPFGLQTQAILLTMSFSQPKPILIKEMTTGPALPGLSHLPLIARIVVE